MLILLALLLVLVFSALVTAILRPPARPAALLSVYLLSYANIVMVGQITNSLLQLNDPWLWLGLHAGLAGAAGLAWRLLGKPSLKAPWVGEDGRVLPAGLLRSWKSWPELWLLAIGVTAACLFSAFLIWIMPANNNDSLATHMSRIGYWMQHGSFFPWSTQRVWQITYPVDMQLQMFWTALFLGSDRIVESIQWSGALAAMAAVFGLARLMGAARPQALFAALLWATFPEIILESTTTQNDLVAGTLFAALLYLLFLGLDKRHTGALALSGLALGLALGTKQTLLFLMPGLALVLLLLLIYRGRGVFRSLLVWGAWGAGSFLLIGVYMYVVNIASFGNPMGPASAVEAQTGGQTAQALLENVSFNTFRLAYQSIDPTGLPDPLCGYGFKLKALVVGKITQALGFPVEAPVAVAEGHAFVLRERYVLQEDAAWYGPLFALLVLPAMVIEGIRGARKKDALRVGIVLLAVTFLLVNAAFRPGWDPFQGRYFIPVITAATALTAFLFRPGPKVGSLLVRWVVAALALTITFTTLQLNSGKPISGSRTIWSMTRLERETIQSFYMRRPARLVEKYVPADGTLGLLTYGTFLEYPFFRENYSRRLVQIFPYAQGNDTDWLREQGVEFVLVQVSELMPVVDMPAGLVRVAADEDWSLYTWDPAPPQP